MNYYETLFIVHPALESGHLKDIVLSVEKSLKSAGGGLLYIEIWGKKRLAYLIEKQKYGTYVQLQFNGEGGCTSNLGIELEHNPNILSYLTTSINKIDVKEQEQDLDTQIAGQNRESSQAKTEEELSFNKDSKTSNNKMDNKEATEETPVEEISEEKATEEAPVEEISEEK